MDRRANYLCNTHSRLASKMLAFDQEKTLSKANPTNTSKSARVARWCSGTTAAPWTDSLANTGNCDGQGHTLPLHRSLHKSSKVCQLSPAASGTAAAPYCSSHKHIASGASQCQILLHLPTCLPVKHWQRCCDSVATDPLLLTLSIAGTGSDAKALRLCQTEIKMLCNNTFLQEMAKRLKDPYGALITFPCPLWLSNTGKDTKLPTVTLQNFEGLPDQSEKNLSVLLTVCLTYSYVSNLQIYKQLLLQ